MTRIVKPAHSAGALERRLHRLIAIILVAAMGNHSDGLAESASISADPNTSMFLFSGFGTLGVVHSSEDLADFTASIFKPNGAGYTRSWSPSVDSLIGGQVIANFSPKLSAMVQAISEQNYDNTYTPRIEWANLKYQLTPEASRPSKSSKRLGWHA